MARSRKLRERSDKILINYSRIKILTLKINFIQEIGLNFTKCQNSYKDPKNELNSPKNSCHYSDSGRVSVLCPLPDLKQEV